MTLKCYGHATSHAISLHKLIFYVSVPVLMAKISQSARDKSFSYSKKKNLSATTNACGDKIMYSKSMNRSLYFSRLALSNKIM